jgi:hypothetical protein
MRLLTVAALLAVTVTATSPDSSPNIQFTDDSGTCNVKKDDGSDDLHFDCDITVQLDSGSDAASFRQVVTNLTNLVTEIKANWTDLDNRIAALEADVTLSDLVSKVGDLETDVTNAASDATDALQDASTATSRANTAKNLADQLTSDVADNQDEIEMNDQDILALNEKAHDVPMANTKCVFGQFQNADGKCERCAPGKYQDELDQTSCKGSACVPGKYWNHLVMDASYACKDCEAGRYTDQRAQSGCKGPSGHHVENDKCAKGKWHARGQDKAHNCKDCPQGRYNTFRAMWDRDLHCVKCGKGQYSATLAATAASTCQDCNYGEYQNQEGQNGCKDCPTGRNGNAKALEHPTSGTKKCTQCVPGKYQNQGGNRHCKNCAANTYATDSSRTTACNPCTSTGNCNSNQVKKEDKTCATTAGINTVNQECVSKWATKSNQQCSGRSTTTNPSGCNNSPSTSSKAPSASTLSALKSHCEGLSKCTGAGYKQVSSSHTIDKVHRRRRWCCGGRRRTTTETRYTNQCFTCTNNVFNQASATTYDYGKW